MVQHNEKPWLTSYPEDVQPEVDTTLFGSLVDMFEFSCEKFRERPALHCLGTTLTYEELDHKARCFAAYLQCVLHVKAGDHVALMLPNIIQYPVALYGILLTGAVAVNVNPMYTPRELVHQLNDSEARIIIVISNFAHTLQKALVETKTIEHVVITSIGDECSALKGYFINWALKYIKRAVPRFNIPEAITYKQVMREGENYPYTRPIISPDDLVFLQYTGGTTGVAKGAMLTHRNMLANVEQAWGMYHTKLTEGEELVVTAIPLYHVFALCINCLFTTRIGAASLLIPDARNIKSFVNELKKYDATIITGVNTLFNALINNEEFCNLPLSKLKLTIGGGTSVQKGVENAWFTHTAMHILEGYGLTECSPLVAVCPYNVDGYTGTIGIPVPSTEVLIRDEQGHIITEVGVPGELLVKGPQVMRGYYGREVATQKVFWGEYLRTGDVACWANDKGYIRLVDRKKDLILVSGFNVYPSEIEDVIMLHPNVLEVAAIGVPSKHSGESVKVFIVRKNKALTEEMVKNMCRKHLTAYKVPKYIEFKDSLPKTNVGKIMRRTLREIEYRKLGLDPYSDRTEGESKAGESSESPTVQNSDNSGDK